MSAIDALVFESVNVMESTFNSLLTQNLSPILERAHWGTSRNRGGDDPSYNMMSVQGQSPWEHGDAIAKPGHSGWIISSSTSSGAGPIW